MRSLEEIKKANECLNPDDDWRDSAVPIVPSGLIHGDKPVFEPLKPAPPPMYKYVKETFNVPATWVDHLKLSLRAWAAVKLGPWGFKLVLRHTQGIKSHRIPVVYEIHADPSRKRRLEK